MKKLIVLVIAICLTGYAYAGNKGIFIKGYMNPPEVVKEMNFTSEAKLSFGDFGDIVFSNIDYAVLLTINPAGDITFHGKGGIVSLKEILTALRVIAPKHFDKKVKEIQKEE